MKPHAIKSLVITIVLILSASASAAGQEVSSWEELDSREIPQWWRDAKFGIFIHWGLYSVPAYAPVKDVKSVYETYSEHYYSRLVSGNEHFNEFHKKHFGEDFKYSDFAANFKTSFFDPSAWAELFEKSGAKYVVLTSKHHDGFCLWPSSHSPHWNTVAMGPHRDIVGSLADATRERGLHFGIYYSLLEWAHPLYSRKSIDKWVERHMIPQMQELVTRYEPEVIFADGEWDYDSETLQSRKFLSWLYNESPVKNTVVVNDRWGIETRSLHGGYYTTEYNMVHNVEGIGDKATHPWEESRGIGLSYGYNRFESVDQYMSSKELIHLLVRTVANGGNLLLNVGPDADGLIPVVMQERLLDIGEWLNINAEAIYSTIPWRGDLDGGDNIYCTQKDGNIYIICMEWPTEPIVVKNLQRAGKVELIGSETPVTSSFCEGNLTITIPFLTIDKLPSHKAWVFKINAVTPENVSSYIQDSWDETVRFNQQDKDDHIGLPHPYTVPCKSGKFQEMYYWDSYFTNVGLLADGRIDIAKGNTENLAFLVERFGKVLNGSCFSFQDHSQPPYLCMMVSDIYESTGDKEWLASMFPILEKEYNFWMRERMTPCGLNRYSTDISTGTPGKGMAEYVILRTHSPISLESLSEDQVNRLAFNARAECESGWDFTPRFDNRCADFCPVDLNANLYFYETELSRFAKILGRTQRVKEWENAARRRRQLIMKFLYNAKEGMFYDYDYVNARHSEVKSAAIFSLLYAGAIKPSFARDTAAGLLPFLEFKGGIAATEKIETPCTYQWAWPNGWAPLQYIAIKGLDRYGLKEDATRIANKYVEVITDIFARTGSLWEKINVVNSESEVSSEGGYEMPPMMGWTAGVFEYALNYK